jgi:hypothetical protein
MARRAVELDIREYVLRQRPRGDKIRHAYQLSTAHFMRERFEVWDVQVRSTGWWVVTNPIGMYSKRIYTSMHDAYWFHLGKRTWAGEVAEIRPVAVEHDRLRKAWRLWEQANDALDPGDETEDFQAVGMRCRQALLAFVKEVAQPEWVAAGKDIPKAADFLHWSEYIADHVAAGSHSQRVRGYLSRRWPNRHGTLSTGLPM